MLGGDLVGCIRRGVQIGSDQDVAVSFQGFLNDIPSFQRGEKAVDLLRYLFCQPSAGGDQDGACKHVMLRLGKQIRRHIAGIGRFIRNDQNLAGTGDGIDAHVAETGLFGQSHEDVAGAGDLIHLGHAFRAEGQGCNGLRAAHLVDFIHARHACRGKGSRVDLSVRTGRGRHDDPFHTRHLCGDHVHQHAGGIGCRPARRVDARGGHGEQTHPQNGAVRFCLKPAGPLLLFMEGTDVRRRLLHDLQKFLSHLPAGFLNFAFCDAHRLRREVTVIQLTRIGKKGFVPLLPHIGDDVRNHRFVLSVIIGASFQKRIQKISSVFFRKFQYSHITSPIFRGVWRSGP